MRYGKICYLDFHFTKKIIRYCVRCDSSFNHKWVKPPDSLSYRDQFIFYYNRELSTHLTTISEDSSDRWPCHHYSTYRMLPRNKPQLDISFPSHDHLSWVEWQNGEQLPRTESGSDPLRQVSCAKCGNSDVKIITKYGYSYYEIVQEAGETTMMEIHCKKCKKYTIWGYNHTYWSSYY